MSKYTTEVRFIVENYAGLESSTDFGRVDELIEKAYPKIFTSNVEFFDQAYKPTLLKKILKHFYTREIGFETVGLWKMYMNRTLEEIMPYYNQLYHSATIDFDPMKNTDIRTERNTNDTRTRNTTDNITSKNTLEDTTTDSGNQSGTDVGTETRAYSDTPQGSLSGVSNLNYLTEAEKNTVDSTKTANHTNNTVKNATNELKDDRTGKMNEEGHVDYIDHVVGKSSGESYSELLKKFRETFLNIDMMVIEEFESCFMQIW